jgi:hypothetical protein
MFVVPAGSTPRQLTTAATVNPDGPRHFVIRIRGKNVHRCRIDQPADAP